MEADHRAAQVPLVAPVDRSTVWWNDGAGQRSDGAALGDGGHLFGAAVASRPLPTRGRSLLPGLTFLKRLIVGVGAQQSIDRPHESSLRAVRTSARSWPCLLLCATFAW